MSLLVLLCISSGWHVSLIVRTFWRRKLMRIGGDALNVFIPRLNDMIIELMSHLDLQCTISRLPSRTIFCERLYKRGGNTMLRLYNIIITHCLYNVHQNIHMFCIHDRHSMQWTIHVQYCNCNLYEGGDFFFALNKFSQYERSSFKFFKVTQFCSLL